MTPDPAGLLDAAAHLSVTPSACAPDCNMRALKKLVQPIAQRQDTFVSHSHGTSTSTPQPSSAAISAASRNMLRASMS